MSSGDQSGRINPHGNLSRITDLHRGGSFPDFDSYRGELEEVFGKAIRRNITMTISQEEEDQGQTQEEFLREMLEEEVEEFGLDSPVAITLQQQLDALTKEPDYPKRPKKSAN
jgi:hypothetical protein